MQGKFYAVGEKIVEDKKQQQINQMLDI